MTASRERDDPNRVSLSIGSRRWEGWQEVQVTRSCERCPNDFSLRVTERFPRAEDISIMPGDACDLLIGGDRVIRGFVDSYSASISHAQHSISIAGRGRCADLVDCSIIDEEMTGTQFGNANISDLARRLARPYGIEVRTPDGDGFQLESFGVMQTDTPWAVIELMARAQGFLAYEDADGNLVLARLGRERHATGIAQGMNLLEGRVRFDFSERFSDIRVVRFNREALGDIVHADASRDFNTIATVRDEGVTRRRRLTIAAEQQSGGDDFSIARGNWEKARRYGRSQALHLVVDSWRDGAGVLWQPNRLVPVSVPALKIPDVTWAIGSVTFTRGDKGETAELVLMPREAFQPQPTVIRPFDVALRREVGAATTAPAVTAQQQELR